MKSVLLRITIFLLLVLVPSTGHATLYEFIVGGTIKNLAKVYVKTTNLAKLKVKYTKKIIGMKEEKFRKYYDKFYVVYVQLPPDLKKEYAFTQGITKDAVIEKINRVNKKDLIKIINKVPSEFIIKQTKHYSRPKDQLPPNGAPVNEMFLWRRVIQKV